MAKRSLPKPRSLTRERRDGGRYRVTLLGAFDSTRIPMSPTWWPHQENLNEPRALHGFLMPVQVRVEGLENVLVLSVDRVKISDTLSRFSCTRVEILPPREGGEIVSVDRLPLDSLVRDAVELATLECIAYPAGYEGKVFTSSELRATFDGMSVKVGSDENYVVAVGWYKAVPSRILREVTAHTAKPRRNAHTEKRDAVVARAWLKAARSGAPVEAAVLEALNAAGEITSIHNARQLIKRVKNLGLIPRTIQEAQK
jgi:hypothetical protein